MAARASRSTAQALNLKVVDVADGDWQAAGVIVHDPTNKAVAHMLIDMPIGSFPMALGVIYDDPRPTFESAVREQNAAAAARQAGRPSGARRQGPDLAGRQGAAGDLRLDVMTSPDSRGLHLVRADRGFATGGG